LDTDNKWSVTYLITGFKYNPHYKEKCVFSNVEFYNSDEETRREKITLLYSADRVKFNHTNIDNFIRARVSVEADDDTKACMLALCEIDRCLDTLVFTPFCNSNIINVGYIKQNSNRLYPVIYFTSPKTSLIDEHLKSPITELEYRLSLKYWKNFKHLLEKVPRLYSESELHLARALKLCRWASLSISQFHSFSVQFILQWMALENLIKEHPDERITDALKKIPKIMKNFDTQIISNYKRQIFDKLPTDIEDIWQKKIDDLYEHRKNLIHEGAINIGIDFLDYFDTKKNDVDKGTLDAIIGRVLPFVGKMSQSKNTISEIWSSADQYKPTIDDCPLTNLGGMIQGYISGKEEFQKRGIRS